MEENYDESTVYSIDEIRDVVLPYINERGFKWARLFGSYARGEADGKSDIDIIVDKGDARAMSIFGLYTLIHDVMGKRSDIFDISEIDSGSFRDTVLKEGVLL